MTGATLILIIALAGVYSIGYLTGSYERKDK